MSDKDAVVIDNPIYAIMIHTRQNPSHVAMNEYRIYHGQVSMHAGLDVDGRAGQGYKMIRCIPICTYENMNTNLTSDVMEGGLRLLFVSLVEHLFSTPEDKDLAC